MPMKLFLLWFLYPKDDWIYKFSIKSAMLTCSYWNAAKPSSRRDESELSIGSGQFSDGAIFRDYFFRIIGLSQVFITARSAMRSFPSIRIITSSWVEIYIFDSICIWFFELAPIILNNNFNFNSRAIKQATLIQKKITPEENFPQFRNYGK